MEGSTMKVFKRILSFMLIIAMVFCIFPFAYASNQPFSDVKPGSWYENDVIAAWQSGLIDGKGDGTFAPDESITLAQAVTLAARIHEYSRTGKVTLKNGDKVWYSTYVEYCVKNRIISPDEYSGRWNEAATRAEMVCIFYYAMDPTSYTVINTVQDNAIPDVNLSAHYSKEVYSFYRAGILTGSNGNYFKPDTDIRRSEVATIISRMLYPENRKSVTLILDPLPSYTNAPTHENVMALLNAFDPTCAYILENTMDCGIDFLDWYAPGEYVADGINTAVHEQAHLYFWDNASWNSTCYLMPDGSDLSVDHTSIFSSYELVNVIPSYLRTQRFDTYIGCYSDTMASQVQGPYGLLNEMTAYYWGTRAAVSLYDYYLTQPITGDVWLRYVQGTSSTYVAYAEFRFFILEYMLYARENYPAVYNGILNNDMFRLAFTTIDNEFSSLIETMFTQYDDACKYLSKNGHTAYISNGYFWIDYTGAGYFPEEYELLMNHMQNAEYVEMTELLRP